ncbi:MAG: YfhO family protein [Deltaproteobacteria bacterium]|nr:YfhO family protein [Deltaproteobacteria bacterium]
MTWDLAISFRVIIWIGTAAGLGLWWSHRRQEGGDLTPWAAVALYWLALMILFWPAIVSNRCLVPADILFQNYPWKALHPGLTPHNPLLTDPLESVYPWWRSWLKAVNEGTWPLWNPAAYCGSPLLANLISASLHPVNLLLLIMPIEQASTLFPFLRLLVAAVGTYALLRAFRLPSASAFLGGLLYALCGVHVVWLSNYPSVNVTAMMPWIFLSLDRLADRGRPGWALALALFSTLQFLGGHPESSFHLYLAALPFFIWRLFNERQRGVSYQVLAGRFALVGSAGLIAVALAAFQLYPFMEYLPLTSRYQEIAATGKNMFHHLDFGVCLRQISGTLITPDFYGNPVHRNYWGFGNYTEQNTHLTIIGLILAALALIRNHSHRGLKRFLVLLALFSFLVAVRTPGLFDLLAHLPLFKEAGNHRLIFVFSFCCSILAALAAADYQTGQEKSIKTPVLTAIGLVIVAGLLHFFSSNGLTELQLRYRLTHLAIFLVFLVLAVWLTASGGARPGLGRRLPWIAAGLVLLEVVTWGSDYNTFVDRALIYPPTPMTDFITSRPGRFRVVGYKGCLRRGAEQVYGYDSIISMDPMKPAAYERVLAAVNGRYQAVHTPETAAVDSPWINFLNVKYIAVGPDVTTEEFSSKRFRLAYDGVDGKVYENLQALPRAFWAEKVLTAPSGVSAFELADTHRYELNRVVVLEPPVDAGFSSAEFEAAKNPTVVVVEKKQNSFLLQVRTTAPGCLVLSEVLLPGWHVRLDGRESRINRANGAFMAVFVPAGVNRMEFYYAPRSFQVGLIISGAGLFVLFLALAGWIRWRRRSIKRETGSRPE